MRSPQSGPDATLDDIARRAGVGPGTLYRHFPTRQDLLEAVYLGEVQEMCRAADDLAGLPPWDALVAWLRQYLSLRGDQARRRRRARSATSTAMPRCFAPRARRSSARATRSCSAAQDAGVLRPDTSFGEIGRLVGTIGGMAASDPAELERMFTIVLDGLRYQPA